MKFTATIVAADGSTRELAHESRYDATAVLEAEINAQLAPGERIDTRPGQGRNVTVPKIARVA